MGAGEDILKRLNTLEAKVDRLLAHLGADRAASGGSQSAQGGRVASVKEIQGDKGDPKARMDPRDWTGASCKGLRASQCPPDFLDIYADQLDWFADHPKEGADPKKSQWDRLDAARCRRWAIEIREGRVTQNGSQSPPATPRSNGNPAPDDGDAWGNGDEGSDW